MSSFYGNIKFNNPASYGNAVITSKCTLDWEYEVNPETILGENGLCVINEHGYSWIGDKFEIIQSNYGLRITSSGIQYTKDGGTDWSYLI